MKIFIKTLGCKLNYSESVSLGRKLTAQGHTLVSRPEDAEVCIVNTCAVTAVAEGKSRQAVMHLRHLNPNATIYATGCYVRLSPEVFKEMHIGQPERLSLQNNPLRRDSLLGCPKHGFATGEPVHRTRAFVKIQDGCDNFCTYCTVPYARGRSRSEPIASVVDEVCAELSSGAKEIVLTGVNIGDFGKHNHETLLQLLQALDELPGDYRVRVSSIDPDRCGNDLIDFVARSKHIAPHFHLPLQSGSDDLLRIMHRHYDSAFFAERVHTIRTLLPYAFIGLDVIVGCRGETTDYFDQTYTFLQSLPISHIHLFTYSDRPRATLSHDTTLCVVPPKEQHRRYELLAELSKQKEGAFRNACEGLRERVLWESTHKGGMMQGHTGNYLLCERPYDPALVNQFEEIMVQ